MQITVSIKNDRFTEVTLVFEWRNCWDDVRTRFFFFFLFFFVFEERKRRRGEGKRIDVDTLARIPVIYLSTVIHYNFSHDSLLGPVRYVFTIHAWREFIYSDRIRRCPVPDALPSPPA